MKLSLCWDQVAYLQESMSESDCPGTSYEVDEDGKTDRKKLPCSALDFLCKELFNILNFFESSQIPLDPGLYISYLRLQSSLNVIRVTVPENVPSVLPFALVRSNPHIMPRAEDVAMLYIYSHPVFQMINLFTYQPDFIAAYCRLSIFLEHFIMVLQYEQRQCLLENDSKVYADQLEKLNDFQQQLDEIWRSSRWISNIASVARDRDRQNNCSLLLTSILEPLSPTFFQLSDEFTDVGYHSDNSINIANRHFQKSSGMDGKVAINGSSNASLRNNPLRKSKVGPESCSSPSDYHFNRSRRHSEKLHKNPLKFEQSKAAFGDAKAKLQSMDSDCLVQRSSQTNLSTPASISFEHSKL
uniref:Uncharacterized protein n=1 Tax=Ditylenchus dipsaci TaxID=166011 RepID=A0A915E2D1_9BILA